MDKVKQIFSSDKSSTHSHDGVATSHQNDHARTSIDSAGRSERDSGFGRGGVVREEPSLKDHLTAVKKHADLPREGEGHQTHDHKHLAAVTKEKHHVHETEEVIREREHDRHVHHVQHHVQPLKDERHHDIEHVHNVVAPTHIQESHVNATEDTQLLKKLTAKHHDERIDGQKEHHVVDKGEIVKENTHHHVHHLVQPVVERDEHHHKTIHTTIPIKQVTHEAPIIHQSAVHEPMHVKDFLKQGGDLKSSLGAHNAGVLAQGDCERSVDGPAEELAQKLKLGSITASHSPAGVASSSGRAL